LSVAIYFFYGDSPNETDLLFVLIIVHNLPISINSTKESDQINEIQKNQNGLWFMGYGFRKLCQGIDDNIQRLIAENKER
jgi:hypothetical protein